uniref:Uncharacterized protein n=1 Tax=Lactuca sativa TaxID=4236 RepID=A0A9R1UHA8_LACSA|nr:hypothetical protein LSAT_V11C900496870 [Lactuca sativa]
MNNCKQVYHETWMCGLPWASSEYVHNLKKFLKVVEDRRVHRAEYDSEDDIHDNLPPFSIGIPSMNVDINDAAYLRSDHNEGSYVEERGPSVAHMSTYSIHHRSKVKIANLTKLTQKSKLQLRSLLRVLVCLSRERRSLRLQPTTPPHPPLAKDASASGLRSKTQMKSPTPPYSRFRLLLSRCLQAVSLSSTATRLALEVSFIKSELTTSPIAAASLGQELRIGSSTFSSGPKDSETIPISYVYNPFSAINNCLIGVWLLRYELDA